MVACLALGHPVAASHTSAARLWGLDGMAQTDVHLVVPRGRSGRLSDERVVVHHGQLDEPDLVECQQLPVTAAARTILDLAAIVTAAALSRATDDALRRRVVTLDDLRRERATRPRMRGAAIVDEIIGRRDETGSGDSAWEDTVFDWIVDAGLPAPRRQYQVVLAGSVAVLDMAYPVERIAVEFDGFTWHGTRSRFDRDRVRMSELSAAGWRMVAITSAQSRADVVDRVRRALRAREAPASAS
jgi:very-short-patch-repair endonuclease